MEFSGDLKSICSLFKEGEKINPSLVYQCEKELIGLTPFLPDDAHIYQRLWHVANRSFVPKSCDFCDEPAKWDKKRKRYGTCGSEDCKKAKSKQTSLKKYGVEHSSQAKKVQEKKAKTNQIRYGSDNPMRSREVKEKARKTTQERYGVDNPMQNDSIKAKNEASHVQNHGHKRASSLYSVKKKIEETNKANHGGEWNFTTDSFKEQSETAQVDKYGDLFQRTEEYKEKSLQTHKERYGDHYSRTNGFLQKIHERTIDGLMERCPNHITPILHKGDQIQFRCAECDQKFTLMRTTFQSRVNMGVEVCGNCNPVDPLSSDFEREVLEYVKTMYSGSIRENDRTMLGGQELDLYFPELDFAIECNGLYWHSEIYKSKKYHNEKRRTAANRSIRLMHIWEDDWRDRKHIVKSLLEGVFSRHPDVYYARKLTLTDWVTTNSERSFLDSNHLQGYVSSTLCLGLYDGNSLIQVMSFKNRGKGVWEIQRLCTKIGCSVVGGAERLFSLGEKMLKERGCEEVISYCDTSYFTGDVYNRLGMRLVSGSIPYHYLLKEERYRRRVNRNRFRKKKLLKDNPGLYAHHLTESEIMNHLGNIRIFGPLQNKYRKLL